MYTGYEIFFTMSKYKEKAKMSDHELKKETLMRKVKKMILGT
jgi:hypothetical protein